MLSGAARAPASRGDPVSSVNGTWPVLWAGYGGLGPSCHILDWAQGKVTSQVTQKRAVHDSALAWLTEWDPASVAVLRSPFTGQPEAVWLLVGRRGG